MIIIMINHSYQYLNISPKIWQLFQVFLGALVFTGCHYHHDHNQTHQHHHCQHLYEKTTSPACHSKKYKSSQCWPSSRLSSSLTSSSSSSSLRPGDFIMHVGLLNLIYCAGCCMVAAIIITIIIIIVSISLCTWGLLNQVFYWLLYNHSHQHHYHYHHHSHYHLLNLTLRDIASWTLVSWSRYLARPDIITTIIN